MDFFMNPALCHAGSRIHKVLSTVSKVIGDSGGGGGGGGGQSTSVFHSVIYLCAMISFSLCHKCALLQFCCSFLLHV